LTGYVANVADTPLSVLMPPAVYAEAPAGYAAPGRLPVYHFFGRGPATEASELALIKAQLKEFAALSSNWDGYGALKISSRACETVSALLEMSASLMPLPNITPKAAGTIALEWQTSLADAYIEIGETRYSGYIEGKDSQPTFLENNVDAISPELLARISFALYPESATSVPVSSIVAAPWAPDQLAA
jgi:hypothetical protein